VHTTLALELHQINGLKAARSDRIVCRWRYKKEKNPLKTIRRRNGEEVITELFLL
jgi:hypothetical protein